MDKSFIQNAINNYYYIDPKYTSRPRPEYSLIRFKGVTWQPNVYALARFIGEKLGCKYMIDIGSGAGFKLASMYPDFQIIGIDYGENLVNCRAKYPFGSWTEHNLDHPGELNLPDEIVKDAVVICADVIEHLISPGYLLWKLKKVMELAPICLLSTPERELTYRYNHMGPPFNHCHTREWKLGEFRNLLLSFQFELKYLGLTISNDKDLRKETILAIVGNNQHQCKGYDQLISKQDIDMRA
ncbi:hypothetical protein [Brevibacillus sp. SYSU BS000544]|uniref:hypothetical protein n=1 Tax=Brevibacillus sp. SYSU BS000544 TaxID=3416443 RepID=UPI003CE4DB14